MAEPGRGVCGPRFDASGKKTENARFVKVLHNGVVIHENAACSGPTRGPQLPDEAPKGPLVLQGDHGPVAFRNTWVRTAGREFSPQSLGVRSSEFRPRVVERRPDGWKSLDDFRGRLKEGS